MRWTRARPGDLSPVSTPPAPRRSAPGRHGDAAEAWNAPWPSPPTPAAAPSRTPTLPPRLRGVPATSRVHEAHRSGAGPVHRRGGACGLSVHRFRRGRPMWLVVELGSSERRLGPRSWSALAVVIAACTPQPPSGRNAGDLLVLRQFTSGTAPLTTAFTWSIGDADDADAHLRLDLDDDGTYEVTIASCTSTSVRSATFSNPGIASGPTPGLRRHDDGDQRPGVAQRRGRIRGHVRHHGSVQRNPHRPHSRRRSTAQQLVGRRLSAPVSPDLPDQRPRQLLRHRRPGVLGNRRRPPDRRQHRAHRRSGRHPGQRRTVPDSPRPAASRSTGPCGSILPTSPTSRWTASSRR